MPSSQCCSSNVNLNRDPGHLRAEDEACAGRGSDDPVAHLLHGHRNEPLSGAVHRHDVVGVDFLQREKCLAVVLGRVWCQMEAVNHRVHASRPSIAPASWLFGSFESDDAARHPLIRPVRHDTPRSEDLESFALHLE